MKQTGKHLNDKQRYVIETMLNDDCRLIDIALTLERDSHGIKYEIIHHRYLPNVITIVNHFHDIQECNNR